MHYLYLYKKVLIHLNIHFVTVYDITMGFTQFWGWGHHPKGLPKPRNQRQEREKAHTPCKTQHRPPKSVKATTTAASGKKQQQQESKIRHDAMAPTKGPRYHPPKKPHQNRPRRSHQCSKPSQQKVTPYSHPEKVPG